MNWTWFHRFGSPPYVYGFARRWAPWFGVVALLGMSYALYGGLVLAPDDYQQKAAFRMVYVHAPSAMLSLAIYSAMAIAAAVGLIWRMKVAHAAAAACAPSCCAASATRAGCARWCRERFPQHGWLRQVPVAGLCPGIRDRAAERGARLGVAAQGREAGATAPGNVVMTPTRRKRLYLVLAIVAGVSLAAWLTSQALLRNVMYSY